MARRCASVLLLLALAALSVWGQGINTQASRDDWEEINFDFDSSVLVDGFPSLLRLAELLQANAGYRVQVVGHTDAVGNNQYNQALGLARANTIRDFLLKYGAQANQITVSSSGETDPRATPQSQTFTRTDEARFMNRRATLNVTDAQGNRVSAGGVGDAIRAVEAAPGNQEIIDRLTKLQDCCDQVLKRLDRLDEIAAMLKDLADQNAALRRDLDGLRNQQQAIESRVNQPVQPPPSAAEVAAAVQQLQPEPRPTFEVLRANVGSDADRNVTFTGQGRFFGPLGERAGIQAQAEYYYIRGQREGQFDIGLVERLAPRFQMGAFASFKHVSLSGNQNGGTLGQASVALDYIFGRGRVGAFATKGFMNNAIINRANGITPDGLVQTNVILERYLNVVDQVGVQTSLGLAGETYMEANVGYLRSTAGANRLGGTLRFIFPLNDLVAFTLEGGVNETLLPFTGTQQGRAVAGIQLGNFMRPKQFLAADHAIPMEIPRVRYEVLERTVRTGNSAPEADAGLDQNGVAAGQVTLNGSASFDPDGDPLTYEWIQEAGAPVTLSAPNAAVTTFNAVLGQQYVFRLVVRDGSGAQDSARVRVSTRPADQVQVLFFTANPTTIQAGQTATLSWRVMNADTVNISGIGNVPAQGTTTVSPTSTITYTLTARSEVNEESANATIVVSGSRFQYCFASPSNIQAGQSTQLNWAAPGATSVTISNGIGTVGASGNFVVSPEVNTTYTLTANGPGGTDSCSVGVTVAPGERPIIAQFSGSPVTIDSGDTSTLLWSVAGADEVTISSLGTVSAAGTQDVSPATTTTYTLTATNAAGSVTAQATVNVRQVPPAEIVSFTASPSQAEYPGAQVRLNCVTTGAATVTLAQGFFTSATASIPVFPTSDTTYTCTATNPKGQSVSQTLTIEVLDNPVPGQIPTSHPTFPIFDPKCGCMKQI